jgi:hypothetical protein
MKKSFYLLPPLLSSTSVVLAQVARITSSDYVDVNLHNLKIHYNQTIKLF